MKTIKDMLKPRVNVFSDTVRDDVLNLSSFLEGTIDREKFFAENYETQGMGMLFETAFRRFMGKSDTGVIKLTQAMGGGKTHNMLALALLADDEDLREKILGSEYRKIGRIKVVTFSGRENPDFGIWGSIAEQLDKKELFSGYYSPLRAPGESAWLNLLTGEKILLLFDELPPYLENAQSITVGNSNLSRVTITALANLFSAIGKAQLANVCLVFSDLKAAYESGSELLRSSFKELEAEADRIAIEIAPVALNSDEVYSILRKRLFEDTEKIADYAFEKNEIAIAYKDSVATSKKLGLTSCAGETVYQGVLDSYPFHPSIRDLYARFKENQNFQQTRGLIKLMRQIVRQFYESGLADQSYLINVFDVNLNHQNMMSIFRQIKPSLEEAVSHDVAQNGLSVAEEIDRGQTGGKWYAQKISKLLLVSSLSTANHGLLGLTESEIFGYLSAPGVDLNALKSSLEDLKSRCWYLKTDNRGRLYFQNTKNMVAEMNTLVNSYTNENAKKELKRVLSENFAPKLKICYEQLFVLPAVDEIAPDTDKISLVIFEPYPGNQLHPDLQKFYDNMAQKNRVIFLSGKRSIMEKLYVNSKKLKAMQTIMEGIREEGIPASDQQYQEAEVQLSKAIQALLSTIRETFVTLYYPTRNGIESTDFKLEFMDNKFNGEEQIIAALREVMKYEAFSKEERFLETMRKKCETRLFTTKEMTYAQIRERAATEVSWQWYHPDQLDVLKKDCLKKDRWRETGGYLVKGPFEKEPTSVVVEQQGYDEKTQEFILHVLGVGGRIYYDIGADPTAASVELTESVMRTREPVLRFVCIDPYGERETGEAVRFLCRAPLKYGLRTTPNGPTLTLETNDRYEIKYTTDGSEPCENGGLYDGEVALPQGCKFVRAVALYDGEVTDRKDIPIESPESGPSARTIDPAKPLAYRRKAKKQLGDTESTYRELELMGTIDGLSIKGVSAYVFEKENESNYVEYNAGIPYLPGDLQSLIDLVRETSFKNRDVVVTFEYKELMFKTGTGFHEWVDLCKLDMNSLWKDGEMVQ